MEIAGAKAGNRMKAVPRTVPCKTLLEPDRMMGPANQERILIIPQKIVKQSTPTAEMMFAIQAKQEQHVCVTARKKLQSFPAAQIQTADIDRDANLENV